MSFGKQIDQYVAGIESLRQSVRGMTREQIQSRPIPGKWSTLECVAHIADFEIIFSDRMMRVISHERPLLLVADENLFVNTLLYHHRDLDEELDSIESIRKKMTRILRGIDPVAASRQGIHTFKGLISLEGILTAAINHIPHHVKYIEEKRKALSLPV